MRLVPSLLPLLLAACAFAAPRPKLVVVISVDQFAADLMEQWGRDLPGGLGRLRREGTSFQQAYQDHGLTETGPGHSVILTGRYPGHTGIVENNWLDGGSGRSVYCVDDPASPVLGAAAGSKGVSARNLQGETLGAWLQNQVPGSRVFAMTGKDRSAILMAGRKAQGVYWLAGGLGFSTASAYAQALPSWLQVHNRRFLAGLGQDGLIWTPVDARPLPAAATYQVRGRAVTMGLPHTILGAGMPRDAAFWERFRGSPFFDQAILDAAEALVEGERLGRGPATDLLALGLSATDYVGHAFGNGGPEMLDNLRRLDLELGVFLDRLQAKVPGLWVVLTADHGAGDFPERLRARGLPGQRLLGPVWQKAFNLELARRLGVSGDLLAANGISHMLYLDPKVLAASGRSRAEVLKAAVAVAKAMPEVAEACSAEELEAYRGDPLESPERHSYKARLKLSYQAGRSGDLLLAFQPHITLDDPSHVAGHGHPQPYDQRVPLIFWGPWRAEPRGEPVRVVDLAATLARELGLQPEAAIDGRPLELKPAHKAGIAAR
jgi:predicted AlkP superfamily pyrophosphatase or phosphodiesterase